MKKDNFTVSPDSCRAGSLINHALLKQAHFTRHQARAQDTLYYLHIRPLLFT